MFIVPVEIYFTHTIHVGIKLKGALNNQKSFVPVPNAYFMSIIPIFTTKKVGRGLSPFSLGPPPPVDDLVMALIALIRRSLLAQSKVWPGIKDRFTSSSLTMNMGLLWNKNLSGFPQKVTK